MLVRYAVFLVAAFGAMFLFPANPSQAAEKRVVKSGQEVVLQAYYQYRRRDCKSLRVVVKIIDGGQHGRVRESKSYHDPYNASASDSWGGRCTGVKIRSYVFYYRSKKGFRGTDHVVLRPLGFWGGKNQHFYITVE